ncbi:MAG: hypothetical protein U9Q15_02900 [Patescibacteria group bacterium]|nr:hypothetical protein [Patescibacteria group bacterium]
MKYSINPLTTEILDQQFDSFIQTLENLKDTGNPDKDRILELFRYTQHDSQYFVAQKDNGEIIGTIKTIIEPKLIR